MPATPATPTTPSTSITVREAVPEEYDEVGHLMVEAYQQYRPVFPSEFWDVYNDDLRDVGRRAERAIILVAEESGAIVGALALYPPGDQNGHWPHDWTGVRVLAVSPHHRRKGIARILMDECARRARAWGSPVLALNTAGYMTSAVSLYEALGFRRMPEQENLMASGILLRAYGIELVPGALGSPEDPGSPADPGSAEDLSSTGGLPA